MRTKFNVTSSETPTDVDNTPSSEQDILQELDNKIQQALAQFREHRGTAVYSLFIGDLSIDPDTVNDVFDDLCASIPNPNARLDVIVDSPGGDIHAAYNLARLFRRFAREELNFIVPRWAKSAATLLVCSGDRIYMSPIAELGPIDPQITQFNQFEGRYEHFSPLSIEATLDLIRSEFSQGNEKLANGLLQRLQFPLTLGGIKKSLDVGKEYLVRLLTTRMFSGEDAEEQAKSIGQMLVENYVDHGFCIDVDEAKSIGLKVQELEGDDLSLVWKIYRLNEQKQEIERAMKRSEIAEMLKSHPEILRPISKPSKRKELYNSNEPTCLEEGKEIEPI